jgi:hypothetical protein
VAKTNVVSEGGVAIEEERDSGKKFVAEPAAGGTLKLFDVVYQDHKARIKANDENEARAIFNDQIKKWPSPKAVTVTEVK